MGNKPSKGTSTFDILVKTSDRFGAGTDSGVYIILHDKNGAKSGEKRLDKFFRNNFERANIDDFKITTELLDEVVDIEIWMDGLGVAPAWHLEYISVEDLGTKVKKVFPFHRWLDDGPHYMIEAYDCSLPQNAKFKEQRESELVERRIKYNYKESYMNLPLQVQLLHEDDKFSDQYEWNLSTNKFAALLEKAWIGMVKINKKSKFKSFKEVRKMFNNFKKMNLPKVAKHWQEDWYFGHRVLNMCNPKLIQLCTKIPQKFDVCEETLEPLLEGKTISEALEAKRLFLIDLTILEGITVTENTVLPNPYCLLYLNDEKTLLPVAIQLFKEPSAENPVYYPSDEENLWTLVKMWFNYADSNHHQASSHLGATHLVMEGICVAMNRTLSLSHPIHKMLAPHFLFLLAINTRALNKLVSPGGWIDRTMGVGRVGLFEIVGKIYCNYDLMGKGDLLGDLKRRGVDSAEILPGYHYRDDAILLYNAISNYAQEMVRIFYPREQDIIEDNEIQAWGQELVKPRLEGLGFTGVPGNGNFTTHDQLSWLLTYIIFTCSVEHAAVNFSQYSSYAFTPAYALKLEGRPPCDKKPRTKADLIEPLCDKDHMLGQVLVTFLLSRRATRALGDFEVVYHHRPDVLEAVEKFQEELKVASEIIEERDRNRKIPYEILNPKEIPNSISI